MNFKLGKADLWLIGLSILGLAVMSYLTYMKFSPSSYFCDISEKFSCSTVSQSSYSEIFGIPVSLLGLLYFAAVGGLVLNGGKSVYRWSSH